MQIVFYKINGYIEEDDDADEILYFALIPDNKENKDKELWNVKCKNILFA